MQAIQQGWLAIAPKQFAWLDYLAGPNQFSPNLINLRLQVSD